MTKQEIIQAVNEGKNVFWSNTIYQVIKDSKGQFLIEYAKGKHYIGLHGAEGTEYENVLNGKESEFFIKD
jgi:hypothetical protein